MCFFFGTGWFFWWQHSPEKKGGQTEQTKKQSQTKPNQIKQTTKQQTNQTNQPNNQTNTVFFVFLEAATLYYSLFSSLIHLCFSASDLVGRWEDGGPRRLRATWYSRKWEAAPRHFAGYIVTQQQAFLNKHIFTWCFSFQVTRFVYKSAPCRDEFFNSKNFAWIDFAISREVQCFNIYLYLKWGNPKKNTHFFRYLVYCRMWYWISTRWAPLPDKSRRP